MKRFFKNTSGTITNSWKIELGKTYYIASAPVALDVTAVDNATFQTYANDAPVEVPCTVDYIMPVKVVYTATPGYAFPDGKTEFTTNILPTARMATMTVTLPNDQWPKPLPPVKVDVSAPEGATVAVYSNKVDAANSVPVDGTGTVLSNSIAYVVYTVNESGKYFENGRTAVTNTLTTATDPATDTSAYVPTAIGKPQVMLGVVAQRYPWDGKVDVQYKAKYVPAGRQITVTVTLPNGKSASETYECQNGKNTVVFDARAAFGEVKVKGAKVTATLNKAE